MANETKIYRGTTKVLEANGLAIANNDVGVADDATYAQVADGAGYPDGEFVLGFTFATAPTENSVISLFARPLDIDGTNDAEVPESGAATFKGEYIGRFLVNNVITAQFARCIGRNLPALANYYLHNNATGQALSAGWTLKVTPITLGPV